jgi:hypothetical protein
MDMETCIQNCTTCHRTCSEALTHILKGAKQADAALTLLLLDCIEICQISADFMIRGSKRHKLTCGVCAEICTRCAEACEAVDDEQMRRCAEICRRCADSCRKMAA